MQEENECPNRSGQVSVLWYVAHASDTEGHASPVV